MTNPVQKTNSVGRASRTRTLFLLMAFAFPATLPFSIGKGTEFALSA